MPLPARDAPWAASVTLSQWAWTRALAGHQPGPHCEARAASSDRVAACHPGFGHVGPGDVADVAGGRSRQRGWRVDRTDLPDCFWLTGLQGMLSLL